MSIPHPPSDLIGHSFGLLTVISLHSIGKRGCYYWNVSCKCGNTSVMSTERLVSGTRRSCGCIYTVSIKKHGMKGSSTWNSWVSMKSRCLKEKDKDFKRYGGRGITVCDRWLRFDNFLDDMGVKPSSEYTIDRIYVNGNYEPGNCRWATVHEQQHNRRDNRNFTINGESHCLAVWCRKYQANRTSAVWLLKRGHSIESALENATKL